MGAKGNTTTWSKQAELITSANIGSQSVNYASSAGSVAWGNVSGKPTIPSVGNGTVTITQNGATKGSFTMNQSGNTTIALTDNNTDTNTTYSASTGLSLSGTAFSVKYGTAAGTACQGNDSRLSNSRPASDVYAWAKASTKPSYSWSEIQSKPTTFPPSKHNHGAKDDYATYARWLLCPPTGRILVLADEGYLRSYNDAGTLENGVLCAGSANYRFKQVYITSSAISTSDRNYKKDVKPLTDKHLQFFMLLQPVSFLFKDGDSGRTHIGFISQDVEKAMEQVGLTDLDFAGFCKDKKEIIHSQMNEDGIMTEQKELVLDENGQQVYIYSLRYEEFIALNTHMIQHLYHKIDAIEQRLNCEKQ